MKSLLLTLTAVLAFAAFSTAHLNAASCCDGSCDGKKKDKTEQKDGAK